MLVRRRGRLTEARKPIPLTNRTSDSTDPTTPHRVVIIGGGFGGLNATRNLKDAPVEVTLVDRTNHHLFQPLLYQVAAGLISPGLIAPALRSTI